MVTRTSHAEWQGKVPEGEGSVSLGSGALHAPYSFSSRFENGAGVNPEELIAAAHAACFSMALSLILTKAGTPPTSIKTTASVKVEKEGDGFTVTEIALTTRGDVPGLDEADFITHAETAKRGCPISKALAAVPAITLDAALT